MPVRDLPVRPDLDQLHRQAKEFLKALHAGEAAAVAAGMTAIVKLSRVRLAVFGAVLLLLGPWAWIRFRPDPPDVVAIPAIAADSLPRRIYVINWGYHTSIVVPQPPGFTNGPANDPAARFIEYAWGDRSFYMESNYWPHRLFAALMLPTASVTYLAGWSRAPATSDGMSGLWSREVNAEELGRLIAALEGSTRRGAGGVRAPAYQPAVGYRGRFYPAHGAYLFWADCNRWTVDRLHDAGLASSGIGVILARQVASRLHGFRRE